MYPTLKDGDYVGVDRTDKGFVSGELYLIHSKYSGYIVKRLEDATPEGIMLKSDNPMHVSPIVEHEKIEHDIEIIGHIAWIFGTRKKHKQ